MRKIIPFKAAVTITVVITLLVTIFNVLVLIGLIPYDMVWGGRIKTSEEMVVFELISILINLVTIFIVLVKAKRILPTWAKVGNVAAWFLPILFFLGIIGNLASTSAIERALFVPLTALLFLLTLRIAMTKNNG